MKPTNDSVTTRLLQFLRGAQISPSPDPYMWDGPDDVYDSIDLLDLYNEWAAEYHRARATDATLFDELWETLQDPPSEARVAAVQELYRQVYGKQLSDIDAQLAVRRSEDFSLNAWAALGIVWLLDNPQLSVVR